MSSFFTYNVCPEDYGAVGDGIADDTTAVQSALNYLGGLPQGGNLWLHQSYAINAGGVTGFSNVTICGTGKLIAITTPTKGIINGNGLSRFRIKDIQINAGDFYPSVNIGAVNLIDCTDCRVEDISISHLGKFGVYLKGGSYNRIDDNVIAATTPGNTDAILISSGEASPNTYIRGNIGINSGSDISLSDSIITENIFFNFVYGAGITTEISSYCKNLVIGHNIAYGGSGTDINQTNPEGIENWAPYSVISGNLMHTNSGDGISQGGQGCATTGNVCYNNGTVGGSGMTARYGTSSANASYSCFTGNACFDTNGASGTQAYGYVEQILSVSGQNQMPQYTIASGNQVTQNKNGLIKTGSKYGSYDAVSASTTFAYAGATVPPGGQGSFTFVLAGVNFCDLVSWGYSASTAGLMVSASVSSLNGICIQWYNPTGSAITLPAGSWSIKAEKNPAATTY